MRTSSATESTTPLNPKKITEDFVTTGLNALWQTFHCFQQIIYTLLATLVSQLPKIMPWPTGTSKDKTDKLWLIPNIDYLKFLEFM
jgi:hypothetical protein